MRLAEALEEEAKMIWTERASATRTYYVAQRAYDEAKARLKKSQIKSAQWADHKKALDTAEAALEKLRQQRSELQTRWQSVERHRHVLTPIARRSHLLAEIEALGPAPNLPHGAAAGLDGATS